MDEHDGTTCSILEAMGIKPVMTDKITGQLILRGARDQAPDGSKRKLMMVIGIIAVPKENYEELKSEHKFTVAGDRVVGDKITLVIHPDGEDVSETTSGHAAGQLLTEPIWRI